VAYLIDTSVLGRLANTADDFYAAALRAVVELHRSGETLNIAPQNLIEFRGFATRPAAVNGLGLATEAAEAKMAAFEAAFPLLPDTPGIFPTWKVLVETFNVVGKQVHDARLMAVCYTHGVTHLLTFNIQHFVRLASYGPGVTIVAPESV